MRTARETASRPQLPPQLYVDIRAPTKPLEFGRLTATLWEGGARR
jgi:hypothetical protein